ncbi:LytR/AlgR family response regulator transcription factor [Flavisolibacter tropicus]|uniref:Response regulatory domain-containing protein n=1 Tax=Flavisolibacter tropicus TaxID=1492898 RepID=A0A172TRT3_9BACT|nr:response regulator [Flavisolibacter tropicus]ANE49473.1 hypothetical protein SY85_02120 [Flavisolibacter tropicus]
MREETSVLIIEDEELWAKSLSDNLNDFGFTISGVASDFESAIRELNKADYDIVLLDIHIDGKESGIELGRMVRNLYRKPFIFITASYDSQTAQTAVASQPSAYLTKPVHPASLFATIQAAIHNFTETASPVSSQQADEQPSFFVKQGEKYKKLFWKDVVCLRSEKNYTGLLNAEDSNTYFIRSTLPKTLRYLVPHSLQQNFIQINRSEAVQLSFINELIKDEVRTPYGQFIVTESNLKELKERLHIIG